MKISEVSARSGVSAKMIRYYESISLIPAAERSVSGYRSYRPGDVHTLRFIRRCRDLGFDMREIQSLLALWRDRTRRSSEVKRLAAAHVEELEQKIEAMQSVVATLSTLMQCCRGDERPDCPILDELEGQRGDAATKGESNKGTENMDKIKYEVVGMTCGGCQRSVAAALERAGVRVEVTDVSLSEGTVSVPSDADEGTVRSAIEDAGFDVGKRRE